MYALAFQRVVLAAIADVFYFPIWWYTVGAFRALLWCGRVFAGGNDNLVPGVWLKNIFVPMYGQYDWQGRIISFFMRLVQVLFRSFALFVWLLVAFVLFLGYLIIPLIIIYGIVKSL